MQQFKMILYLSEATPEFVQSHNYKWGERSAAVCSQAPETHLKACFF